MRRYALRAGEPLAIDSGAIRHDADGLYLVMGDDVPENESRGTVTIVTVRGALSQFKGDGGDSYEGLTERVGEAFGADPKPEKVLLSITSPGGVVAGLNECVGKLRAMSTAAGIPLVAWVPSLAASAAFALCCACEERLAHESAVVGSCGVISTMVSVTDADRKQGLQFRLITSGKRKADGHLHGPITDAAESAERDRNNELAQQFFALASKATGLSPRRLQSYEAAIFLGRRAVTAGLIDNVSTLDEVLLGMGATVIEGAAPAPNGGNVTDRRAKNDDASRKVLDAAQRGASPSVAQPGTTEAPMSVKLEAVIKQTLAAIGTEADPRKKVHLQGKLASLYVAQAAMDGDEDAPSSSKPASSKPDSDDESAAAKHAARAKKMAAKSEAMKHRAKAAELKSKAAESEEEAKRCEEEASGGEDDEEEKAKASAAAIAAQGTISGGLSEGALAALTEKAAAYDRLAPRLASLESVQTKATQNALVQEAVARRCITRHQAKQLESKPFSFVQDYILMHKTALVNIDESALATPDQTPAADLPAAVRSVVEQAVAAKGLTGEEADKFRERSYAAHRKALTNGAGVH